MTDEPMAKRLTAAYAQGMRETAETLHDQLARHMAERDEATRERDELREKLLNREAEVEGMEAKRAGDDIAIDELRASVEALLVLNQNLRAAIVRSDIELMEARAEIERLKGELEFARAEVLTLSAECEHRLQTTLEARDEVGRLKETIAEWQAIHGTFAPAGAPEDVHFACRAEVERLQRENGALARTYALAEEKLRERTEALAEMLESFTEPEDDNDILRRARAALR